MNFSDEKKQFENRKKEDVKSAFVHWMSNPLVRASIAAMPPCKDNPELLGLLLETAFKAGYDCGGGAMVADLFTTIIGKRDKPPSRDGL